MVYSGSEAVTAPHDRSAEGSHVPASVLDDAHAAAPQAESSTVLDDVYASAPPADPTPQPPTTVTLRLTVEPDPNLLVRVMALLGNIGVVPTRLSFLLLTETVGMITIELRGMGEYAIDLLQRKLASLPQCMAQASHSTGSRSHALPAQD